MRRSFLALAAGLVVALGLPASTASATFPGHDGLIVFSSNRDGDYEIWTMKSNGSSPLQLTHNSVSDGDPKWSANGNKIVWEQTVSGHNEIYTMSANGSNQLQRTSFGADSWSPGWAPDNKHIVFASNKSGNYDLYTMNANGTHVRRLFHKAGDEEWPSYSPSGRKIVYDSNASGDYQVWVVNADGSHRHKLTSDPRNVESSWAPNGKSITFESNRPADTSNFQLFRMKADGSAQAPFLVDPLDNYYGPSYSPSRSKYLFYSNLDGDYEVYTMSAPGPSIAINLTNNAFADTSPNWQPT